MRIFLLWVISIFIYPNFLIASGENPGAGARSMGLGHASIAIHDPFALFNNISGIADLKKTIAFTSYELPYGLFSLKRIHAGFVFPVKNISTGLSVYNFGNEYYHEFRSGIGAAHKIKNVSLGLKVNYNEISISEIKTQRNIIFEFGGITEFSKNIHFGASVYNFTQAGSRSNSIPVSMKAGLSIIPIQNLKINIETVKTGNFKPFARAGIEYLIGNLLSIRTGISTDTFIGYFGFGINHKKLSFDYGSSSHPYLGISHSLSFIYTLRSVK